MDGSESVLKDRRCVLIFNPASGPGGSAGEAEKKEICRELEAVFVGGVQVVETTPEGDMAELVKRVCTDDVGVVVASGGDGTVSEVAATLPRDKVLGVIPRGTGNAFAAALGIPVPMTDASYLSNCVALMRDENIRTLDVARCESGDSHSRQMILLGGIGLEAKTVERADRGLKDRLGAAVSLFLCLP